jgi:RHS repeat-associated protein
MIALTAGDQTATQRRETPFGAPRGSVPSWPNEKGFVGGTMDPTGTTHLGAREYDPTVGRFISADPVIDHGDPQQQNGYAYANNSPVTMSDPRGRRFCDGDGCAGGPITPSQHPAAQPDPGTGELGPAGAQGAGEARRRLGALVGPGLEQAQGRDRRGGGGHRGGRGRRSGLRGRHRRGGFARQCGAGRSRRGSRGLDGHLRPGHASEGALAGRPAGGRGDRRGDGRPDGGDRGQGGSAGGRCRPGGRCQDRSGRRADGCPEGGGRVGQRCREDRRRASGASRRRCGRRGGRAYQGRAGGAE